MPHDGEPYDTQRIGDGGNVWGRRCDVAAGVGARSAIPRAIMRHPADAALGGGWEQRLGRLAKIRRAGVPDNRETTISTTGKRVVDVEAATVAQPKVALVQRGRFRKG